MYSGVVAVLLLLALLFFLVCKRRMLSRVFSLDFEEQVRGFEEKIETTANSAVERISAASGDLSSQLAQAEDVIGELKIRNKLLEEKLYEMSRNELNKGDAASPPLQAESRLGGQLSFAEQLIKANYQTATHLDGGDDGPPPARRRTRSGAQSSPIRGLTREARPFEDGPSSPAREQINANEPPPAAVSVFARKGARNDGDEFDMSNAEPKFRRKHILRLAANGHDDIYIARALRLGVGEVRLTRKLGDKQAQIERNFRQ